MTRRFFALLALVAAGFATLLAIAPTQVSAAPVATPMVTCSGTGCDGRDPVNSGCAASGSVVRSTQTAKGTFRLYYSSVCRTNWIQTPNYTGGGSRPDNKLQLTVWDVPRNKYVHFFASPTRGVHYGAQGGAAPQRERLPEHLGCVVRSARPQSLVPLLDLRAEQPGVDIGHVDGELVAGRERA